MPIQTRVQIDAHESPRETLSPLSTQEVEVFMGLLKKLRDRTSTDPVDKISLSVFLIDRIHNCHTEEMSAGLSILVNKLVNKPFMGDRMILKSVLESIMECVSHTEKMRND